MSIKLSPRLQAISEMIPRCDTLADIGTDHAYLPIYCIQHNICKQAIAGDVAILPCEQGEKNVHAYGLDNRVVVRCGSGLHVLAKKEVECIVISGMGGGTMVEILRDSPEVLEYIDSLILQPQNDFAQVRSWLADNGWFIDDERLVKDNEIIYQIIRARHGSMKTLDIFEATYGPILFAKEDSLLLELLVRDLDHYKSIAEQLVTATTEQARERLKIINCWITELELRISLFSN